MDERVILQVLAEQKEELEHIEINKLVNRTEEQLFEFDSSLAQVVIGLRRAGKSTLCHKVLRQNKVKYAYVNFDDDRLWEMCSADFNVLLNCIYQLYGTNVSYIFFDEIQNVEGWHLFVNRLMRQGLHIIVTGSNAKLLSSELATHLTGRYNEIRLYPFSFREFCSYHKVDLQGVTTKSDAARKIALKEYLFNGGFPELQNLRNKRGYIESLLNAITLKDIKQRYKIRHIEVLQKLVDHLINNNCQELNYKEMAKLFGIGSGATVTKYISYLQQVFLIGLVEKFSFKSKERLSSQKSYTLDPGFIDNRDNMLTPENLGWRLENVVYIELLRRGAVTFDDVFYYKPSSRAKEVDFVICHRGQPIELLQVAFDIASPKTLKRECSALVSAAKALNCRKLAIVTMGDSRTIEFQGFAINIYSAIDWLLKN